MRNKEILNKREKAIIKFIEEEINEKGYPPTVREIGEAVGLSSTATVYHYLLQLDQKQYIEKQDKHGRALKLLKDYEGNNLQEKRRVMETKYEELVHVPIIGKITAGMPILAYENILGHFPMPSDVVGTSDVFMLTVEGTSMINVGIYDGDYILVRKQNDALNGQFVVALIGDEATVKTFYKEEKQIRLQPENDSMEPIIVDDCKILGIVIGVFRKI